MRPRLFQTEQWLPRRRDEVFPFFGDAGNLEAITPPWVNFHIMTPRPIQMRPGALIDYRLRIRGVPVRWRTEITEWDPPHRFVDQQIKGPYRRWHHTHTFEPQTRGGVEGTLCRDIVEYAVPFDRLVHGLLVRPDIERIFAYRRETLARIFPPR